MLFDSTMVVINIRALKLWIILIVTENGLPILNRTPFESPLSTNQLEFLIEILLFIERWMANRMLLNKTQSFN
jgi:hypothetical protein